MPYAICDEDDIIFGLEDDEVKVIIECLTDHHYYDRVRIPLLKKFEDLGVE